MKSLETGIKDHTNAVLKPGTQVTVSGFILYSTSYTYNKSNPWNERGPTCGVGILYKCLISSNMNCVLVCTGNINCVITRVIISSHYEITSFYLYFEDNFITISYLVEEIYIVLIVKVLKSP